MKCSECSSCKMGYFPSRPLAYVCTGVKHPFVIDCIENECPAYPEKRSPVAVDDTDDPMIVYSAGPLMKVNDSEHGTSTIKDSGDRTEFKTGAVRDMREGKGRCDLMPLNVVGDIMIDQQAKATLHNIYSFQVLGDTDYLKLCIEDFARHNGGCDTLTGDMCTIFLEVAKHFEEGAKKYGENNWQKGIPVHCYIDSAVRHYLKWLRGDTDEPHDRAFVWNIMCCIWEVDYHEKKEDK